MRGLVLPTLAGFFRRIRVRLTLWYVFLLAIILIVFSVALYLGLERILIGEVDLALRVTAGQAASELGPEDFDPAASDPDGPLRIFSEMARHGYVVVLWDDSGRVFRASGPYSEVLPGNQPPETGYWTEDSSLGDWRFFATEVRVPVSDSPFLLQVGESLHRVDSTMSTLLVLEAVIVPSLLCLAVVVGLFLAGRALKPIEEITGLASGIESVDLSRRLDLDLPDDELGRLARTFDLMLERLDSAFSAQKRFVSEAAHELRTPLTVMKGTADVALSREREAGEYREALIEMKQSADQLALLADDLLELSRADSDSASLEAREVDLGDTVAEAIRIVSPIADEKGIRIDYEPIGPAPLVGDPGKLTRMLLNLLDNSVKYSPPGSTVCVSVEQREGWITTEVRDTGPGIEPVELELVFSRFHRSHEARKADPGGSGLGLPIARWIARAHGGDIEAGSTPGEGATFTVHLPARGR